MSTAGALELGREAFARQAWRQAFAQLALADREAALGVEDLERLAAAAQLIGREEDSSEIWARAHQECLRLGDTARAARCAFRLGMDLLNRGEMARGGGWLARARRLLEQGGHNCVEQGYLLMPVALRSLMGGDAATAHATFGEAARIGSRFDDPDLTTLAGLGQGQALIHLGRVAEGVALLDEVMIAVTTSEVSPFIVGLVYCAVIETCQEIFDLLRAREWSRLGTRERARPVASPLWPWRDAASRRGPSAPWGRCSLPSGDGPRRGKLPRSPGRQ